MLGAFPNNNARSIDALLSMQMLVTEDRYQSLAVMLSKQTLHKVFVTTAPPSTSRSTRVFRIEQRAHINST
jgi:hypothetical protein